MNQFEKWLVNNIIKREVVQGHNHARNIEELYLMIRVACEAEFTEDNVPTMDAFLLERFEVTQLGVKGK